MPPSPSDNAKAKELLSMMKSVAGNIPMPIAFASEDGSPPILLDEMIQHLETMEQANNAVVVAGVAQPAEQGFRKAEAAGSNPAPSSKGLNHDQHQLVANIVHHRVGAEENRRAIDTANAALKQAEKDYKKAKAEQEKAIANAARQGQFHMEQMLLAEEELRQSILSDVIVKGAPEPETSPEADDHEDQIGRAG